MTARSALVTGATGFIGSHLTRALVAAGWSVKGLARSAASAARVSALGATAVLGDLDDPSSLRGIADGVDDVFHTAAKLNLNLPGSMQGDFGSNLGGTENLVQALRGARLRSFVHVSSLAAIGIRPAGMIDESYPPDPDLAYGKSKLATDLFLLGKARDEGLPVRILRPPTVYGPGERYNFLSLCRALRSGKFLLIGRGDNRIDFCAVENLVQAMSLAADRGKSGETYLVADDRALPFRETVDVLSRLVRGRPSTRAYLPVPLAYALAYPLEALGAALRRPVPLYPTRVRTMSGDLCFDIGKARRELGYQPAGPFARLVRPTIEWYWAEGLLPRPA